MEFLASVRKAIVGGVGSVAIVAYNSLTTQCGHAIDWKLIALAVLTTGGVYLIPNKTGA